MVRESADLLYNLTVLWASAGVLPEDVWREMERREHLLGIAEKLPKSAVKMPKAATPPAGCPATNCRARKPQRCASAIRPLPAISLRTPGMDKSVPWWFIAPC